MGRDVEERTQHVAVEGEVVNLGAACRREDGFFMFGTRPLKTGIILNQQSTKGMT